MLSALKGSAGAEMTFLVGIGGLIARDVDGGVDAVSAESFAGVAKLASTITFFAASFK